ncbi:MAG: hypothetical protein BM549_02760 [Lacinutrix sp. MedPE-SW]|nr:MAG: hypothetical protein BM549_02760 [Lacinutrix sp. MedPE-SW]
MRELKQNLLIKIAICSFYIVILFDFITKVLLIYSNDTFSKFSFIPKVVILCTMLFVCFYLGTKQKIKFIILYTLMFFFAVLAYLNLYLDFQLKTLYKQLYSLLLYSYPFILVSFFNVIGKNNRRAIILSLEKHILIIGVISSILIFIGLITKIELFRSYSFSNRFGYNGIFLKTSEASYFYICLLLLCLYLFNNKYKLLFIISTLLSSLLVGTKVVWLSIFLIILIYSFKKYKKTTAIFLLIPITVYFNFRQKIDSYLIELWPRGEILYNENGIITILTSTRDILLERTILFSKENWSFINYLFGGNKYWLHKVEFEFIDLFFLFGIFGIIIFYLFLKNRFINRLQGSFSKYTLIIILICAFFAGNFFKSFLSFTVFYLVFEIIILKEKKLLYDKTSKIK